MKMSMTRISSVLFFALCGTTVSCAASLGWQWQEPQFVKAPDASKYEGEAAVYLLREQRVLMYQEYRKDSYTERQAHDVLAILNEKGYRFADVRIVYPNKSSELVAFAARTINDDGTATPLEPEWVFDDEVKAEENGAKVRVFTFPNVKVGSILEYQYTLRDDNIDTFQAPFVSTSVPIEKYHLELTGTQSIKYSVNAYNIEAGSDWDSSLDGDYWKLSWHMENIPATKDDEERMEPRRFRDPWWMFTVLAYQSSAINWEIHKDWENTVKYRASALFDEEGEYYDGFAPEVDDAKCADEKCKIQAALDYLRAEVPFDGFDDGPGRDAKELVDSKRADNWEKARLMWDLMRRAKIDANYVFTNRRGRVYFDMDHPHYARLKHVILWIPKQDGITDGFYVDPSCEFCSVGQVPDWVQGEEGFVIRAEREGLSTENTYKGEWKKIEGLDAPADRVLRDYAVTVDAEGHFTAKMKESRHGWGAQWWRTARRKQKAEAAQREAEKIVSRRDERGQLVSDSRHTFSDDGRLAERTIEMKIPDYAVKDRERMIVPLSALYTPFDEAFEDKERKHAVYLSNTATWHDRLTIRGPSGYSPTILFPPKSVDVGALKIDVTARAEGDIVVLERTILARAGTYPVEDYAKIREAMELYRDVDRGAIVFARPISTPMAPAASR